MNGILGFISLLQEPELTGEEKDEYIRIVKKSGDRLLNTIHDIIDIAKIESGQTQVVPTDLNINELTANMHAFFKKEAEIKGLQLFFTSGISNERTLVKTDKDKLHSILTNLIKNAIKYTKNGFIEFGSGITGNSIEFYVRDTGIGIPLNKRQAIFERFVQADVSHSRPYEGSGLGLSISKAYVDMLGGKMWIESQEGLGSTFYFQIPLVNPDNDVVASVPEVHAIPAGDHIKLKILVTEDDVVNFNYLHVILTKANHTAIHAITGGAAVELCRQNPSIDIVLMDIKLPDMDGYTATREIRKFNSEIPIIALTAYAFEGDREKAIEAGCNDYLPKPVKKEELILALNKYKNYQNNLKQNKK